MHPALSGTSQDRLAEKVATERSIFNERLVYDGSKPIALPPCMY